MKKRTLLMSALALATAAATLSGAAHAQDFPPKKPVTLVVGFAAGGAADAAIPLVPIASAEGAVLTDNAAITAYVEARWPSPPLLGSTPAEKAEIVARHVRLVGLAGFEKHLPIQLSGGMRQRVAIARVLALDSPIMLMDEPFGAVDAKVRQELREWLIRLHTDLNVTSLFVTHDQEEAMEVSGRIIVFSKGKLEQAGTPADVYEEPATEFVARFIGSMNIVEGIVRRNQVQVGSLEFPAPGFSDGQKLQVGFRPYYVKVAEDATRYRQQAKLRHIYFLGVAYRLEIETADGLILRSRMNKEEFRR